VCGLAGAFAYSDLAPNIDAEELIRIREEMRSRGPDSAGFWRTERVGFAHRRLAIIDLSSAGAQPMGFCQGRYQIVFNGEIYNYRELRSQLVAQGISFQSESDTEVLLALFHCHGERMLSMLRGMFAFAIWDQQLKRLFLARDHFGIKPLYYWDDGATFRFASQVEPLARSKSHSGRPEPAGHAGFFLWGFVPEPYTLYKDIVALGAGCSMYVTPAGAQRAVTYFDLAEHFAADADGSSPILGELAQSFVDSVKHHMVSDVPVGLYLSAGIDSSCLAAVASKFSSQNLRSVTLGFNEFQGSPLDEAKQAAATAARFGIHHETHWLSQDDFGKELEHFFGAMDQPSVDGLNTYLVSRAAAKAGMKVALSGLGGDEVLGGYPSFTGVPRAVRALSPLRLPEALGRTFRYVSSPFSKLFTSPKYSSVLEYGGSWAGAYFLRRGLYMPWELSRLMDPQLAREGLEKLNLFEEVARTIPQVESDHLKVSGLEHSWYLRNQLLRDSDWAGMASSVEIRVPFVDTRFIKTCVRLERAGRRPTKSELAKACLGEFGASLSHRKKTGFHVPVRRWAIGEGLLHPNKRGLRGWADAVYLRKWPKAAKERRVLMFRIGNLGDSLITIPAIQALREQKPTSHIALLTNRYDSEKLVAPSQVFEPTNWFDSIYSYSTDRHGLSKVAQLARLISQLRSFKPSTVFDLSPSRNAWQRTRDATLFKFIIGADQVISMQPNATCDPSPSSLPRLEPEWARLMKAVTSTVDSDVELPIPNISSRRALEHLREFDGHPLVAFAPGSKMQAKLWPIERFRAVLKAIAEQHSQVCFAIVGGKEDFDKAELLREINPARVTNLAGLLSIYESAAVLRRACLYVGNDTGAMHLASLVKTPCVAVFSARDNPGRWDPMGNRNIVLRRTVECQGCMLETCLKEKSRCLTDITVDDVLAAIAQTRVLVHVNENVDSATTNA
jgi:asparagine synthase (glutamine-hydrolysing)